MARREFLQTLVRVAAGSGCSEEPGGWPLGDTCRAAAAEGFWILVQIGLTGSADDAGTVAEICEYFNLGGEKSTYYQALLHERARAKTKRRATR